MDSAASFSSNNSKADVFDSNSRADGSGNSKVDDFSNSRVDGFDSQLRQQQQQRKLRRFEFEGPMKWGKLPAKFHEEKMVPIPTPQERIFLPAPFPWWGSSWGATGNGENCHP
ncbi:hypothetical protein SLEP1_g9938 [Rubroshorea leprosula]|uniref:Uncharacterized protein n=1 Tax=Rubroshorea leprosula TaxID=152421 RepID=A0AAV5IF08_9ROSI|nr:hypothetical protein SLEP1_g9938 [Rubroshorea leprosula]